MNKYNGKLNKVLIIAGFLALLAVNALILSMEYRNYAEKWRFSIKWGMKCRQKRREWSGQAPY